MNSGKTDAALGFDQGMTQRDVLKWSTIASGLALLALRTPLQMLTQQGGTTGMATAEC